MNDRKRYIMLLVIGILIVICVLLGGTYAFMGRNIESESVTDITLNNCAKMTLLEKSSAIDLKNASPMSDNAGMQTTPYSFTIKSSCSASVEFKIYLGTLSTNTLSADKIKYAIKEKGSETIISSGNLTLEAAEDFNDDEKKQITTSVGDVSKIYTVMESILVSKTSIDYELYLWVDSNASDEIAGQIFSAGVLAKGFDDTGVLTIGSVCQDRNMATCMKENYALEETLFYHDTNLENGAEDNSYRYAGANPNNYVCFGSDEETCPANNLYRIIGIFDVDDNNVNPDYQIKLIKNTSLGNYYWSGSSSNSSTVWSESTLNTENLNGNSEGNYLYDLGNWAERIATHTWQVGGISGNNAGNNPAKTVYAYEVGNNSANVLFKSKVGLMYLSDYGFAASSENWTTNLGNYNSSVNNWLFSGAGEWLISRESDSTIGTVRSILTNGSASNGFANTSSLAVRPSFYLESTVRLASGSGTSADPYRIA